MHGQSQITVVIPHFESPDDLAEVLRSIADQAHPSHTIVVDNSETAHGLQQGRAVAIEMGAEWRQMVGNIGFGSACNAGANLAATEFIMFLNQDARLTPGTLTTLTDYMSFHPAVAATSPVVTTPEGKIWFAGGKYSPRSGRIKLRGFGEDHRGGSPSTSGFLSGCALVVRRSRFLDVNGFDERFFLYYEDVELSARLTASGSTLVVVPGANVVHFRNRAGDPLRNLTNTHLEHTIRSRRIFASTLPTGQRWVAHATLPLEMARLGFHAGRAAPQRLVEIVRSLGAGLRNQ